MACTRYTYTGHRSMQVGHKLTESQTYRVRQLPLALKLVQANAQDYQQMEELEVTCYAYGHSDMRGFRNPDTLSDPAYRDYVDRHRASYGKQRSTQILNMNLHNVNFYPGASAHPRFLQLRVIKPLSVDRDSH